MAKVEVARLSLWEVVQVKCKLKITFLQIPQLTTRKLSKRKSDEASGSCLGISGLKVYSAVSAELSIIDKMSGSLQ